MNDRGYKLASDQESMAFWKKVVGDYFRYAYEACKEMMDIKQMPAMLASEAREKENKEATDARDLGKGGFKKDGNEDVFMSLEDLENNLDEF